MSSETASSENTVVGEVIKANPPADLANASGNDGNQLQKRITDSEQDESKLLHGKKLAVAFAGMLLTLLLVAIDQTILAPALPHIADRFNALTTINWVVSSYILTQACFLLTAGQVLLVFNRKWVYFFSIIGFELGSLICATAPNMVALCIGRAIAGIGGAFIFVSIIALIAETTRLKDRPLLMGLFAMVFGASSIAGPICGGAFASSPSLTWRWCFWINLPVGGVALIAVILLIPSIPAALPKPESITDSIKKVERLTFGRYSPAPGSVLQRLATIDYVGSLLLVAGLVMLLLGFLWAGTEYAWNSATIIGLLIGAVVTLALFILYEWKGAGSNPVLPLRFLGNRSLMGCALISFCIYFAMLSTIYYLPLRYQAVQHHSAQRSGIDLLPFVLAFVLSSIIVGGITRKTGRYYYFLLIGPFFLCVGSGLLFTTNANTSTAKFIGYQILFGLGVGFTFQQSMLGMQACVKPREVAQASAVGNLFSRLGGSIGIAIDGVVFNNKLSDNIGRLAPTANREALESNVASIWSDSITPPAIRPQVIDAYTQSLKWVFIIGVPLGGVALLATILVKNINLKTVHDGHGKPSEQVARPPEKAISDAA